MPVSRTLAENLARTLVDIYGRAAERMAADVAGRLDQDLAGIDRPDWAERRLLAAEALHEQSRRLVARLDTEMAAAVEQMTVLAAERGSAEALRELGRLGFALPSTLADVRRELPGAQAVQRLAFSLTSTLRGTHLRITRWPIDVYRDVTSRASADILLGTATRRQAAQQMWEEFVSRGVTGFVDRSGRAWRLESYVDMASRTIAAQAAVEAHLDRLAEAGVDLVIVSDAPEECPLCRPWEGRVLDRGAGGARTVEREHATQDGVMVQVDVAGSVDQAVGAGLLHPNCRHSLSGFFPGITTPRGPDPGQPASGQPPAATPTQPPPSIEPRSLTHDEAVEMQERMLAERPWSREQIAALSEYSGGGYLDANPWLRGQVDPDDLSIGLEATDQMIRDAIAGMRPLPEPVKTTRRVGLDAFGDLDRPEQLAELVGAQRQEPAFMSTSIQGDLGEDVGEVLMELRVPEGTPAAYLEPITQSEGEFELLLAPGTRFAIVEVIPEGDSTRMIVEVLS